MWRTSISLLGIALLVQPGRGAEHEQWRPLAGKNCECRFRASDGALVYFGPKGGRESVFRSAAGGLWEASLGDRHKLNATGCCASGHAPRWQSGADQRTLRFDYASAELDVAVTAQAGENSIDLWAELTPHKQPLLEFGLPGRLEFSPERIVRLVAPASGNESVGFSLRPAFFRSQPAKSGRSQPAKSGYYEYRSAYPPAMADFFHWDTLVGSAAVYRVAPRSWEPWQATKNPAAIFIPGRIAFGGAQTGGWCERPFGVYVPAGRTWRTPTVRLKLGDTAPENLADYCRENQITRRLPQKMTPELLEKFKQAVLVYYAGDCRQKLAGLASLPRPALVHFADYLHGGFDKQYPDHLPPAADFGSPEEFRGLLAEARRLGHLVMPYTNPTWWCDGPRGPTFVEHGEAPLLRLLDGGLSREKYSKNEGFTICHWHQAVQAANRKTVRQFTEEYPVDVLFQDQCGARRWHYDFNPASPTPYAYVEGLLSMVAEDARRKPLSTESGWDGVVNDESQLCGMTWAIVPTEGRPSWSWLIRDRYQPATWEVFPVAQYVAHDKTAMVHHDLGQFVTNSQVLSWTLGLGFAMSDRISPQQLREDSPREWLLWLDRLQKSVCARYLGQPTGPFEHDRGGTPDDGVIRAAYGDVRVVANLDPRPRQEAGFDLAQFGFACTAPGLVAAHLASLGGKQFGESGISFLAEEKSGRTDIWVYAPPEQMVCVKLAGTRSGKAVVDWGLGRTVETTIRDGVLAVQLPSRPGRVRVQPPPELAGAPRDWPGPRPALGVIDGGSRIGPGWTRIGPRQWIEAWGNSRLAREWGLPVKAIHSAEELETALKAGPRAWLAIVNPYGERFPAVGDGPATLDLISSYVNRGGCWWETAGYSFFTAVHLDDPRRSESLGRKGMDRLGLSVRSGEVDEPARPIAATAVGREWLGRELADRIGRSRAIVNRGLPRGTIAAPHLALIAADGCDYVGGYRLDGWGWLWRVGGFWPDPELVLPVVVAVMERLYERPQPAPVGGVRYVWHAEVR